MKKYKVDSNTSRDLLIEIEDCVKILTQEIQHIDKINRICDDENFKYYNDDRNLLKDLNKLLNKYTILTNNKKSKIIKKIIDNEYNEDLDSVLKLIDKYL